MPHILAASYKKKVYKSWHSLFASVYVLASYWCAGQLMSAKSKLLLQYPVVVVTEKEVIKLRALIFCLYLQKTTNVLHLLVEMAGYALMK